MTEDIIFLIIIMLTSLAGFKLHSLNVSGALAAILVGIAIYAGFKVNGLIILGVFFATSSLWSKYKGTYKRSIEEKLAKGSKRDWRQVAANGGAAALFSILHIVNSDNNWLMGFIICIASANSDTWASEIGSLSKKEPVAIRSFKRVERGTSGAISVLGSIAAILGSLLISIISFLLFQFDLLSCFIIFLFGFLGNVIDTIFGAFYQQLYICNHCGIETEKKFHCEAPTNRIKGLTFIDNDMVNFLSGFIAAIAGMGVMNLINR